MKNGVVGVVMVSLVLCLILLAMAQYGQAHPTYVQAPAPIPTVGVGEYVLTVTAAGSGDGVKITRCSTNADGRVGCVSQVRINGDDYILTCLDYDRASAVCRAWGASQKMNK